MVLSVCGSGRLKDFRDALISEQLYVQDPWLSKENNIPKTTDFIEVPCHVLAKS